MHPAVRDGNDAAPIQQDHRGAAGDDRAGHDAWHLALGRPGGSYRTAQAFFYTTLPWAVLFWVFFRQHVQRPDDVYILAGDAVVVNKAGGCIHGLDRFFASLQSRVIPGLAFFTLALISLQQRRAFPVRIEQIVRSEAERAASQAQRAAKPAPKPAAPRPRGRPKGTKNQVAAEVVLSPELLRIQAML